jgi:hypothetical protein
MSSINVDFHLPPNVVSATKTLCAPGQLPFDIIQIGDYPMQLSIMTRDNTTPDDLERIASAFREAAQAMRERRLSAAAEVDDAH